MILGLQIAILIGFGWIVWEPLTFAILKHQLSSATTSTEERAALVKARNWGRPWEVYLRDTATGEIAPNFSEYERLKNDPEIEVELDIEWLESSPFGGGPYRISHRLIDKTNIDHFFESP